MRGSMETIVLDSVLFVLVSAMLPLVIASLLSLIVGFIQTLFQIQEQTLLFLVRLSTCIVVLLVVSTWCLTRFVDVLQQCTRYIAYGQLS